MSSRHYKRAPITEAIIDLRVEPRADLALDELAELHKGEEERYPKKEVTCEALGLMEFRPGVSASASASQVQTGYKFTSTHADYMWQSRRDGFTLSRLAPYESWQPFRDEARRLWASHRERTNPQEVLRLAVRYINRVDIPAPTVDLKEYFRTGPEVSPDLPQQLAGFFLQVRLPMESLHGTALINQTIIPPDREGVISVVLDIDVFRSEAVPAEESAIWDVFERLHACKNEIFEASITSKTRELFD